MDTSNPSNDDLADIETGKKYGYPMCCIEYFVFGPYFDAKNPRPLIGGEWEGTGFMPCPKHQQEISTIGLEKFVDREIAPRRVCSTAFPDHSGSPGRGWK